MVLDLATKSSLDAVTRVLSKELGPKKIRVSSINPGGTETEGAHTLRVIGSDFQKHLIAKTSLGRFGQPEDIAPIAVFLASDASGWLTGEILRLRRRTLTDLTKGRFHLLQLMPKATNECVFANANRKGRVCVASDDRSLCGMSREGAPEYGANRRTSISTFANQQLRVCNEARAGMDESDGQSGTALSSQLFDAFALGRQAHFLEKFDVSRVVAQILEQRIAVDLRQSGVSLFVGMFQPFK